VGSLNIESLITDGFFVFVTTFLGFVVDDDDDDEVVVVLTRRGRLEGMVLAGRGSRKGAEGLIGDMLRCRRVDGWVVVCREEGGRGSGGERGD
jgi:hypothetical protein